MEVFCMGKPNSVSVHPVGNNSMVGSQMQKGRTLEIRDSHRTDTCIVDDNDMHFVHSDCSRGIRNAS